MVRSLTRGGTSMEEGRKEEEAEAVTTAFEKLTEDQRFLVCNALPATTITGETPKNTHCLITTQYTETSSCTGDTQPDSGLKSALAQIRCCLRVIKASIRMVMAVSWFVS